jgi:hypothetical protein
VREFGATGRGDGQFHNPWSAAVWEERDLVFVVDSGNNRISVHRLSDGSFVRHFGDSRQLLDATGIAISTTEGHELAFITDFYANAVSVWGLEDGLFVNRMSCSASHPVGIAISASRTSDHGGAGTLHVAERDTARVIVLRFDGSLVRSYGDSAGMRSISGLALHDDLVCVSDRGNARVCVFAELDGSFLRAIDHELLTVHLELRGVACGDGWVAVSQIKDSTILVFSTLDGSLIDMWDSGSDRHRLLCWGGGLLFVPLISNRVLVYQ